MKIVPLVLIKKKGKLWFLILGDRLGVGNILEAIGQSFRAVAEVDRIGRLLGFGGHLDFKCWCGGQIVQLNCSNGDTKRPIRCDQLGWSCRQVLRGGWCWRQQYSSRCWWFRFTCLLGLFAPFPSQRFRWLLLWLTMSQFFFSLSFGMMINANPQRLISQQRYDWFRWNNDFLVTWCRKAPPSSRIFGLGWWRDLNDTILAHIDSNACRQKMQSHIEVVNKGKRSTRRPRWLDSERDSRKMTSKIAPSEKFLPYLTELRHRIALSLFQNYYYEFLYTWIFRYWFPYVICLWVFIALLPYLLGP